MVKKMGKRLISQRRGKGSHTFKAKHKGIAARYSAINTQKINDTLKGHLVEFIKDTGRNAILARIKFNSGEEETIVAAEGLILNQPIQQGKEAGISIGNISEVQYLPEGCPIFNIEKNKGDGGVFVKSAGNYALLMAKDSNSVTVKMPSGKLLKLPLDVRATIGNASCGGKSDKPFVKAGTKFYAMKAKRKMYPTVRGVAMNAVDHPFGGAQHHPGKSKSTSRNAPPGRKVGAIASKRTGRAKKG